MNRTQLKFEDPCEHCRQKSQACAYWLDGQKPDDACMDKVSYLKWVARHAPVKPVAHQQERRIYINLNEYDTLVNLLEDALLTQGELDSTGHEAAFSILTKVRYPPVYRNRISERLSRDDFRYQNARRCQQVAGRNQQQIDEMILAEKDNQSSAIISDEEAFRIAYLRWRGAYNDRIFILSCKVQPVVKDAH